MHSVRNQFGLLYYDKTSYFNFLSVLHSEEIIQFELITYGIFPIRTIICGIKSLAFTINLFLHVLSQHPHIFIRLQLNIVLFFHILSPIFDFQIFLTFYFFLLLDICNHFISPSKDPVLISILQPLYEMDVYFIYL